MPSTTTNPPSIHAPAPTYSHICTTPLPATSTLITISGQVGITASGTTAPTYAEQIEVAFSNLDACLAAAGATKADIIKVTHYIVNHDNNDRTRAELYVKYMGELRPPSTLVGVACLAYPELLYEIEAMAVVSK